MQKIYLILVQFSVMLFLLVIVPAQSAAANNGQPACFDASGTKLLANTLSDSKQGHMKPLIAAYFIDSMGTITADAITDEQFQTNICKGSFNTPAPKGALWLRFKVANPHASDMDWVIAFTQIVFDEVALYEQREANLVNVARNGRSVPLKERAINAVGAAVPFNIGAGEERIFYLRLTGTYEPIIKPLIVSQNLFTDWTVKFETALIVFLGFIAAMAMFSLVLFRQVEARFYRYYTLYLGCIFAYAFLYDGWLSWITEAVLPVTVVAPLMGLASGTSVLANILYCRVLLIQSSDRNEYRTVFIGLSGVALLTTILAVIDPWALSLPLYLFYVVSPMVLLVIAIKKIRKGLPQALPVAASLVALILGLVVSIYLLVFPAVTVETSSTVQLMLLRSNTLGFNFAIVGEAIFIMISLSTLVKAMQAKGQAATVEAEILHQKMVDTQNQRAEFQKTSGERIKALESILADDPNNNLQASVEQQLLQRATKIIHDHMGDDSFGVKELATSLGTSEKTLGRRLKASHGLTPVAFIRSVRLEFARNLILLRQFRTITEIAHAAGFSSVSHFTKLYRQHFGKTPKESAAAMQNLANSDIPPSSSTASLSGSSSS
ncbi:MAG: helix-turn-helix domain-containing protein [Rhizobiaceae bacterium]|nr:helix-turn-helix domain-containing protein [Rhizobiaceae bacterium]